MQDYEYQAGFGNQFQTEALPGALPKVQNTPHFAPYGLYTEQINGSSFTVPRNHNLRTWVYKIHPATMQGPSVPYTQNKNFISDFFSRENVEVSASQPRWKPFDPPTSKEVDFINGIGTLCGSGEPSISTGLAIHIYSANADMKNRAFINSDGDFLIIPQQGSLDIQTELGKLYIKPNEFAVIPRGIHFKVNLVDNPNKVCRGYILEVYGGHFELPDLGPIGANGLANPRDFMYPVACYEHIDNVEYKIIQKFQGQLFEAAKNHSPFDVVSWHGNYAPYKYDLEKFCPVSAVLFDHPDPSIFSVLTCKSNTPGTAVCDFVVFPPRYIVMENTFRPASFHRNCMSEFVGSITDTFDLDDHALRPGGASLHHVMVPHGPDSNSTAAELIRKEDRVFKIPPNNFSFMFESMFQLRTTKWSMSQETMFDRNAFGHWKDIKIHFDPTKRDLIPE
ncbi:hypothetical protein BB560_002531 [Smittium megazygosporum]|uniref:homogentisate 1,2-dioxygenase n=1 Tax=Smittium megazygosporum TaxID=133381 RepID=A0A2T9ZEI6_9FUNG|nr:hypothetical protein BB560_002531 [Smittium megazygosporum]